MVDTGKGTLPSRRWWRRRVRYRLRWPCRHRRWRGPAGFALLTGYGSDLVERSRAVARDLGRDDSRSRWFLAFAHLAFGDAAAAEALLTEALPRLRADGDRWGEAAVLAGRAKQALFQGDLALVASAGQESLAIFEERGDDWGRLQASDMLGYLAEITGDYARADQLHREGLRLAETLRLWVDVSYRLSSLGRVALLDGDLNASRELHARAMSLAAEQSHRFAEEFARVGLGLVARRAGHLDEADRLFRRSLRWNRQLEADYGVPYYGVTLLLAELGFVAEQRGDLAEARALHLEGLAAARELDDSRAVALAKEGLAGVAAAAGAHDEATTLLAEAAALRASVRAPLQPAERGDVDRIAAAISAGTRSETSA